MPGIIVKDVHRTKQRINTTCDGINLLSFFPAKVETQGGGGGVNMELITPSWEKKVAAGKTVGLSRCPGGVVHMYTKQSRPCACPQYGATQVCYLVLTTARCAHIVMLLVVIMLRRLIWSLFASGSAVDCSVLIMFQVAIRKLGIEVARKEICNLEEETG